MSLAQIQVAALMFISMLDGAIAPQVRTPIVMRSSLQSALHDRRLNG